ncbi:MAG: tetraacyldisaccharide 4'-kinase [Deltaproteobacteria bacterium]|nr:tetraacyldisaccharide 4'-kinase [Deltaproteobacteria bacterium]
MISGRARIERAFWSEQGSTGSRLLDRLLQAAALGFEAGVRLRNRAFDVGMLRRHPVACPVICVGNLTVGGAGKTPVVAALAAGLAARGESVAVLSRGYGGRGGRASRVIDVPDPVLHGDEPAMLAALLPTCRVVVGPDRVRSAGLAIASGATVVLLDDGFQHRRLARDVDIVVVDGTRGFGSGFLLPRGPLREPPNALRRAHLVLVKEGSGPFRDLIRHGLRDLAEGVPLYDFRLEARSLLRADGARDALTTIRGRPIAAVSGIGNPAAFAAGLRDLGAQVVAEIVFPDHHAHGAGDLRRAEDAARRAGAECIVTTSKDFTKFRRFAHDLPLLALEVEAAPVRPFDWIEWVAGRIALARGGAGTSPQMRRAAFVAENPG